MVKKPHSDEYRLCVDYRLTNAKTTPESFPTMTLEEIWEIIGVHKPALFSKLDLMSGYHQLAMHPDTKHKSTFVVRGNSYQWNRLPFGLRNAPITFQKLMADVLKDLLFKTCLIYLDDIIVWGDCIECHKKNLQEVFDRLEKAYNSESVKMWIRYGGNCIFRSCTQQKWDETKWGKSWNFQKLSATDKRETTSPIFGIKSILSTVSENFF